MTNPQETPPSHGNGSTLTVTVYSPRHPDPVSFTFANSETVGEAAQQVATSFGYVGGTPTFKNATGEVLDRNKPLRGEHVRDGDELELVDVGGGV
jgi:hypothetical protein